MAHLVPEYTNEAFVRLETPDGESFFAPAKELAVIYPDLGLPGGHVLEANFEGKWFWRLTAPGYLDCTEWTGPYDTLREARQDLRDTEEIDPDTGEPLVAARELAMLKRLPTEEVWAALQAMPADKVAALARQFEIPVRQSDQPDDERRPLKVAELYKASRRSGED